MCFKIFPVMPWARLTSTILFPTALTKLKGLPLSLFENKVAKFPSISKAVISLVMLTAVATNPRTYSSSQIRPRGNNFILGFGSSMTSFITPGDPDVFFLEYGFFLFPCFDVPRCASKRGTPFKAPL